MTANGGNAVWLPVKFEAKIISSPLENGMTIPSYNYIGDILMKQPHKHCELIKALADGAEIQCKQTATGDWLDVEPNWHAHATYRIKPEQKPDVVLRVGVELLGDEDEFVYANLKNHQPISTSAFIDHIKLTFDGETRKLKSAEVIS